jgi:hypothetical protein
VFHIELNRQVIHRHFAFYVLCLAYLVSSYLEAHAEVILYICLCRWWQRLPLYHNTSHTGCIKNVTKQCAPRYLMPLIAWIPLYSHHSTGHVFWWKMHDIIPSVKDPVGWDHSQCLWDARARGIMVLTRGSGSCFQESLTFSMTQPPSLLWKFVAELITMRGCNCNPLPLSVFLSLSVSFFPWH